MWARSSQAKHAHCASMSTTHVQSGFAILIRQSRQSCPLMRGLVEMNRAVYRTKWVGARQRGSYLLDGLIALLIFAFGVLGLIGMIGGSIRASNDARYRAEAINLANAMVGDMWTTLP